MRLPWTKAAPTKGRQPPPHRVPSLPPFRLRPVLPLVYPRCPCEEATALRSALADICVEAEQARHRMVDRREIHDPRTEMVRVAERIIQIATRPLT